MQRTCKDTYKLIRENKPMIKKIEFKLRGILNTEWLDCKK